MYSPIRARAHTHKATERDDEGCTSGQKVWAHVCTREQLKDLLQLDLSEEELQLPPLLVCALCFLCVS